MTNRIARLGKETALYGLSTMLGRMVNFLLVPLYANYLLPEENGVIATLYSYIAFMIVVYGMGMEQAFMRHWVDVPEGERGGVFRSAMIGVIPGLLVSVILWIGAEEASRLLGFSDAQATLIALGGGIVALDSVSAVPFAFLRMERRPLLFALLKSGNIAATLLLTVWFVAFRKMGAEGVFSANILVSAATAVVMIVVCRRMLFSGGLSAGVTMTRIRQLLSFGLPLVPAGLAGIALQVIDRPIVRSLTDDATVGLYQLNARLAIFMMLAVGMFDFAWRPFFLQHAGDKDAKELFSRVFTLFLVLLTSILLAVSLFVEDLVRLPLGSSTFFPEFYWQGTAIVPVFLAANLLTGAYVVFLTGVYLEKRTGIIPFISGTAAAVTIAGILLLVPMMGIMGAALAALAGHAVQTAWMYREGQKRFRVEYEWASIGRLAAVAVILFLLVKFIQPEPMTLWGICVKVLILMLFVGGLFALKIVSTRSLKDAIPPERRSGSGGGSGSLGAP